MTRLFRTEDVRAPRGEVFRYLTEVERFPKLFPEIFARMEVVGGEGERRLIVCEEKWAGHTFSYTMREKLSPPDRIDRVITDGSGKGTAVSIELFPSSLGTRVTMTVEVKGLFASLCGGLSRAQFEREVQRVFEGYLRVAEAAASEEEFHLVQS